MPKLTGAAKRTQWAKLAAAKLAAMTPDSIISIKNMRTQKDSVKIKEVIAIKVFTQRDISLYNKLYINGILVEKLSPLKTSDNEKIVYFELDKRVQNQLASFLKSTPFETTEVPVYFSVGASVKVSVAIKDTVILNNKASVKDTTVQVTANVLAKTHDAVFVEVKQKISKWWVFAAALLVAITAVYALKHDVLKDNANLYYSLASVQLFYWSLLFVIAYLGICLDTDTLPDIPLSVLAILGISVSTTAVAKVIDDKAKGAVVIDEKAESQGWFVDILSDGSSINIQRFQNVAFNAFFGVLFLQRALSTHLLPDFDDNVLLLLGVSAGAYAGLKHLEPAKEQTKESATTVGDLEDKTKAAIAAKAADPKSTQADDPTTTTNPDSSTGTATEPPSGATGA
nr:hypothetical protein [uncultured Mucilaginibacter sp.]